MEFLGPCISFCAALYLYTTFLRQILDHLVHWIYLTALTLKIKFLHIEPDRFMKYDALLNYPQLDSYNQLQQTTIFEILACTVMHQ